MLDTDLLTPLGAYLRLRSEGRASFLLESVEQGRLGRYSLVGCGSRVLAYEEAEACGEPVVGYLAYDFVAKLEPTVPMPDAGRGLPESRFVVADMLVRFDHVRGVAEVLRGEPDETTRLLESDAPRPPRESGSRSETLRLPTQADYERGVVACKEHIRNGDAFQIVLSQRAERPTSISALALYRSCGASTRRPTSSCSSWTGSPSSAPRRRRSSSARDRARRSTRSPARRSRATATPSGCSPPRRTAPST